MLNNSARKPANSVDAHLVTPKSEKQEAERRSTQDALEDDEVQEALAILREQTKTKSND